MSSMRHIVKGLSCAALFLCAAPLLPSSAVAAEAAAAAVAAPDKGPYLFQHACKSGISVRILTSNIKVQEALTKLFDGHMTPYEFLDFVGTNAKPANASRDEAAALNMLAQCMEVHIHKI